MKIIWIIGSPRSGTSFLTDCIGKHADHCFNEPWDKYPLGFHQKWKLPEGLIVFKYCANCLYYDEIKTIYPNSKWVHIIRNPIHVLYSMVFPKEKSKPIREWKEFGFGDARIINAFNKWKSITLSSLKIKEAKVICYENIDYFSLSNFLEIKVEPQNFINRNNIFEQEKMNYLKNKLSENELNPYKILSKIYL